MRTKFVRMRFLTKGPVQFRYLALLVVSMIAPLVFVGGCLYYLVFRIMAEQLGIPESIAYNLVPVVRKINMIIAVGVPPIFLVLILWGIVVSHRFTGPLERLKGEIDRIAESGDYKKRIRVRRSDDIRPVADSVNHLLDNVERKHHEHR